MGNRISLNLAKNVAKSLQAIFFGIPAARARQEHAAADVREADADIRKTEASIKNVDAYDRLWDFLEKAGFSEDERKAIIAGQITAKSELGDMIKHLQVISDLVKRGRIRFQITGQTGEPDGAEDGSQEKT